MNRPNNYSVRPLMSEQCRKPRGNGLWPRLTLLPFLPIVCMLGGCIFPHTTMRSPEIGGRVLDARTGAPVQGAKVFLYDDPSTSCKSDATGHFRLRETRNFHLGGGPGGDHWPAGDAYDVV